VKFKGKRDLFICTPSKKGKLHLKYPLFSFLCNWVSIWIHSIRLEKLPLMIIQLLILIWRRIKFGNKFIRKQVSNFIHPLYLSLNNRLFFFNVFLNLPSSSSFHFISFTNCLRRKLVWHNFFRIFLGFKQLSTRLNKTNMASELMTIVLLGVSFFLVITPFQTGCMIQKVVVDSIIHESNVITDSNWNGYYSLCIIYFVFSMSNWIAPSTVSLLGCKWSMFFGGLTYWYVF